MMRRFRSLLIDRAEIRLPGLTVNTFALHRHLAEHASVAPHEHRWCQALLYVSNRGRQTLEGTEVYVAPGTLIVMPPGVPHAFQRVDRRAPLCLMVNFRIRPAQRCRTAVCSLNRSALIEIRNQVARLIQLHQAGGEALVWEGAPIVLKILMLFLRTAGWIETRAPTPSRASAKAVQRLLNSVRVDEPLGQIARRSGYHRDHLNRLVKQETGLSIGQFRARQRLAQAKELLARGTRVSAVAAAVGLPDQGYFARWFRRQTGQVPSRWVARRQERAADAAETMNRPRIRPRASDEQTRARKPRRHAAGLTNEARQTSEKDKAR